MNILDLIHETLKFVKQNSLAGVPLNDFFPKNNYEDTEILKICLIHSFFFYIEKNKYTNPRENAGTRFIMSLITTQSARNTNAKCKYSPAEALYVTDNQQY